jgi:hypothetical protein
MKICKGREPPIESGTFRLMKYVLLLPIGLLAACAMAVPGAQPYDPARSAGSPVEIQRFGHSADSLIGSGGKPEPSLFEIRDEESWRALWQHMMAGHSPAPSRPAVNFDREMLLGAFMGRRSSGGYTIEIVSVRDLGENLHATVVRTSPGPECVRLTVETTPADIVRVDRLDKPVRWETRDRVRRCPAIGSTPAMQIRPSAELAMKGKDNMFRAV